MIFSEMRKVCFNADADLQTVYILKIQLKIAVYRIIITFPNTENLSENRALMIYHPILVIHKKRRLKNGGFSFDFYCFFAKSAWKMTTKKACSF